MNWIEIKEEDWIGLECTNAKQTIYVVRYSPTIVESPTNDDVGNELPHNEDEIIKRVVPIRYEHHPSLSEVKADAIALQKEFDKSYEVNSFNYNGDKYWFSKEERLALVNSFTILQQSGETTGVLWLNNTKVNVYLDYILAFLHNLELYAITCNNITREHIVSISNCKSIEEVAGFDITADYPNQLELTV